MVQTDVLFVHFSLHRSRIGKKKDVAIIVCSICVSLASEAQLML